MEGSKRKLIVLLCMHRSGSSLTANLLQQLGMSLGPFELIAAAPSNPYGHFEALPFHIMNRRPTTSPPIRRSSPTSWIRGRPGRPIGRSPRSGSTRGRRPSAP